MKPQKTGLVVLQDSCGMQGSGFCPCPLDGPMETLGRRWAISVVVTLGNFGGLRFNELQRRLGRITPKTLTDRLRELEGLGLVQRAEGKGADKTVRYSLTPQGVGLREALIPMARWAATRTR